jgi:hypothetical protein
MCGDNWVPDEDVYADNTDKYVWIEETTEGFYVVDADAGVLSRLFLFRENAIGWAVEQGFIVQNETIPEESPVHTVYPDDIPF